MLKAARRIDDSTGKPPEPKGPNGLNATSVVAVLVKDGQSGLDVFVFMAWSWHPSFPSGGHRKHYDQPDDVIEYGHKFDQTFRSKDRNCPDECHE
ncbi:hypothetical protein V8J82_19880 [Gymnodinialimonas sp. 2305UL16-5]|uniref:hypothetical protein n=1 Tax=Gymnodinialimonas mytili TaxID=3126503 RepID=UPI0030977189